MRAEVALIHALSDLAFAPAHAAPGYAPVSSLSRATRSCSSLALLMQYSNSRPL